MASDFIGGGIPQVHVPQVDSTAPHDAITEAPAPIQQIQPPASNAGFDDPTGGIAEKAGGLSSTAGIGSPITAADQQTVVGSVLEYAFGKQEKSAAGVEAAAPTSATVTTDNKPAVNTSGTYIGAITGAAVAGGAAIASIIPGMASSETPAATATGSVGGSTLPETTTAEPTLSEKTAAEHTSSEKTTTEPTLSEKATEVTESAKAGASEAVDSAAETATAAKEEVKEAVTGDKTEESKETAGDKTSESKEPTQEEEKAKKVSDHEAAVRTNPEAIPTAGGEKLGTAHEGESKVIPDVPPPAPEETAQISSTAGQPDSTTADNTAKNAGDVGAPPKKRMSILGGNKKNGSEGGSDKPKFMDRLKSKLNLDKKDKS